MKFYAFFLLSYQPIMITKYPLVTLIGLSTPSQSRSAPRRFPIILYFNLLSMTFISPWFPVTSFLFSLGLLSSAVAFLSTRKDLSPPWPFFKKRPFLTRHIPKGEVLVNPHVIIHPTEKAPPSVLTTPPSLYCSVIEIPFFFPSFRSFFSPRASQRSPASDVT